MNGLLSGYLPAPAMQQVFSQQPYSAPAVDPTLPWKQNIPTQAYTPQQFTPSKADKKAALFKALGAMGPALIAGGAPSLTPGGGSQAIAQAGQLFNNAYDGHLQGVKGDQFQQYQMGRQQNQDRMAQEAHQVNMAQAGKPQQPMAAQEYLFAKSQGFNGSFMDYLASKKGPAQPPGKVQEYQYAVGQGYKGTFADFLKENKAGTTVNVGDQGPFGKPPTDHVWARLPSGEIATEETPDGYLRPKAIPVAGSSADRPTDSEYKAAGFATRVENANAVIDTFESTGAALSGAVEKFLPNPMKDSDRQQLEQAQRNFVNAVLRRESGAVISDQEFENAAEQYFPQPGDTQAVIDQKRQNRMDALDALRQAGGRAYSKTDVSTPSNKNVSASSNLSDLSDDELDALERQLEGRLARLMDEQKAAIEAQRGTCPTR